MVPTKKDLYAFVGNAVKRGFQTGSLGANLYTARGKKISKSAVNFTALRQVVLCLIVVS